MQHSILNHSHVRKKFHANQKTAFSFVKNNFKGTKIIPIPFISKGIFTIF